TFHSFGFKILKRYARSIGFVTSFSVLDEADSEELLHRCCVKLGFFKREKRFPKKDTLRNIISMAINKKISIKEVLKKEYPHLLEYASEIKKLSKAYAQNKIEKNYLDYDDLLVYLQVLLENEQIRERITKKYKYIMVDEYQDTNPLQGDITFLMAKGHRNIMAVGDDAQSIYGFRGTSHENIMAFPKRFPECKIVKLEENYRSTQSILDVSNAVLENMKNKYSKCLVSARKVLGSSPRLFFFKDIYDEADWIASEIKKLRDQEVPLRHQAVLFRSSYIAIPLQAELSRRNIPYQVFGGLRFYETAHVKDVMAHLKALLNPKDDLAWSRALMLIGEIGPKTSELIVNEILAASGFNGIVKDALSKYSKGYRYSKGLAKLSLLFKNSSGERLSVGEKFENVYKYYKPILKAKFDDWPLRLNDLKTLRQISSRYDTLEEFLADLAIEPPERGVARVDPSSREDERPLTLSTIHSAKGLEWDCVFIIGLMEGVLPVSFAIGDEDEVEEENRLFYVAITRAKNRLFLSFHHEGNRGGITQFNKISRFVDTANVLSKLEKEGVFGEDPGRMPYDAEFEEEVLVYDKDSLTKRVIDYF
ncbi:MAG: ATP-dependent helicase, partial [Candidatus Omnitrophica bacterium]|nr:ATP-dependent helicase [Candidatus Omnitrophota bacterium]